MFLDRENYGIPGRAPEFRGGVGGFIISFFKLIKSLPRRRGATFELLEKTP